MQNLMGVRGEAILAEPGGPMVLQTPWSRRTGSGKSSVPPLSAPEPGFLSIHSSWTKIIVSLHLGREKNRQKQQRWQRILTKCFLCVKRLCGQLEYQKPCTKQEAPPPSGRRGEWSFHLFTVHNSRNNPIPCAVLQIAECGSPAINFAQVMHLQLFRLWVARYTSGPHPLAFYFGSFVDNWNGEVAQYISLEHFFSVDCAQHKLEQVVEPYMPDCLVLLHFL